MLTYHKVEQGSSEWHALRIGKVTASNAAVLLARGKKAATGTANISSGGFWAERGHILEVKALEAYEAVYDVKTEAIGFMTNDQFPDAGYSPDNYVVIKNGIMPLEVKCFKEEKHLACLEDTPIEVYAQIQFGLMISESDMARLIHYNPDIEDTSLCFKVIDVPRDEQLIKRFKEKLYDR
jgi:hypothetical protein